MLLMKTTGNEVRRKSFISAALPGVSAKTFLVL